MDFGIVFILIHILPTPIVVVGDCMAM